MTRTRTTIYSEVIEKIEDADLSISDIKQLYIRALRGNLEVGRVDVRVHADLYDSLTTLPYVEVTTYKDFISRYITAIVHQSLTRAGYKDPNSIINRDDYKQDLHEVLLAADWEVGYEFNTYIYFHILPVELNHKRPVSLFFQRDEGGDDFQIDGVHYSVPSAERYSITSAMVGELQSLITLYSTLNDLTSAVQPSSITVVLNHWSKGIHFLDVVLWDGLFSYNTEEIYRWMISVPEFIY